MKIEELIKQSMEKFKTFNPESVIDMFVTDSQLGVEHGLGDIRDKENVGNYCWFPGFLDLLKLTQVVELGSAMGVAINCMLASPHKDFKLYGVTLAEDGLEFCFVKKDKYPNFFPIVGDYMDLSIWEDVDLKQTDFWYIDGIHQGEHVKKQLLLYKSFFKKGTIIALDDIFMNSSMLEMWHDLENILDISFKMILPLHWSGWGLVQIGEHA